MLEYTFMEVYTRFKLQFYRKIFARFQDSDTNLTAIETFCVETIHALKSPTIQEFSSFIQISSPNATYKVNSLIKKGYVTKVQSKEDKREYHLQVTEKFHNYYAFHIDYTQEVIARIHQRFSDEDVAKLEEMLSIIAKELMQETDNPTQAALSMYSEEMEGNKKQS